MISSADFNLSLPRGDGASAPPTTPEEGTPTARRGEADDKVSGKSHDRQRAVFMSATGQLYGRLRAVSRGRCHPEQGGREPPIQVAFTIPVPTTETREHATRGCGRHIPGRRCVRSGRRFIQERISGPSSRARAGGVHGAGVDADQDVPRLLRATNLCIRASRQDTSRKPASGGRTGDSHPSTDQSISRSNEHHHSLMEASISRRFSRLRVGRPRKCG
jgi:hypothetical protein